MTRPVELSVLMPVHNGERHMREAIESILGQSFRAFELIIVDDGSTDGCPAILDEYSRQDARVRVTTLPERVGVARALNAGIERVSGALIARMDADDVARPDRFAIQLEELRGDPTLGIVGTQIRLIGDDGRPDPQFSWLLPTTHDRCVWQLLFGAPICHPSVMMRTDIVRALDGYDSRFPNEDMELWTRMAFITRMRNINAELLDYRLSGPGDRQKQASWKSHARDVGRIYAERILGRPVAEAVIRAMQHYRSTGAIDPAATDLEALAASSLEREVFERMTRLGLLDGDSEIIELLAEDCQHREAAVVARASIRP